MRALRARTPRVALLAPDATAVLMEDGPRPTLEVTFRLPKEESLSAAAEGEGSSGGKGGGALKWKLSYRLRDHRLLIVPPPGFTGSVPLACYMGACGGGEEAVQQPPSTAKAHSRLGSGAAVQLLPPFLLPSFALSLYATAMRMLPSLLAQERRLTERDSQDLLLPLVVSSPNPWLKEGQRAQMRGALKRVV